MVFFYISMAFSIEMKHKHAKENKFTLLYTFHIMQSIYLTRNAKDPNVYGWKMIKQDYLRRFAFY